MKENINLKVVITEFCNFNCKYCFYSNIDDKKKFQMNYAKLEKFTNYIASKYNVESITVTGGEPLLYPEIEKAMILFHSITNNIILCTNGSLITEDNIKMIDKCVKRIDVSLDDLIDSKHSYRMHVKDTYKKLDYLKNKLNNEIKIGVAMSINKDNYKHISEMKNYCSTNGFGFGINIIQNENKNYITNFSKSDIKLIVQTLHQCGYSKTFTKFCEYTLKEKVTFVPCKLKRNNLVLFPNGDVSYCYNRISILGNIYINKFDQIVNNYVELQGKEKKCYCYRKNCFAAIF